MLAETRKLGAVEKTGQEGGEAAVTNAQHKCASDACDLSSVSVRRRDAFSSPRRGAPAEPGSE